MEKTRMPRVAGFLDIISGALSFPSAFAVGMGMMYPDPKWQIFCLSMLVLLLIAGVLAIVGGIYAMQKKKWGMALAGSIAALFPLLLPGIASIIFIARSKKEFQLENTWMPTLAGLLDIISGVLSVPCSFLIFMGIAGIGQVMGLDLAAWDTFSSIIPLLYSAILVIGILAIVGGLFAFQRKKWGLALAGSIAALFPLLLPGIASIIFIARSKKEFQLRKHVEAENVWGLLCYILGWISGIVFILIKRQNKFVRFHAMQSIIVFGTLTIVNSILWILSLIYFAGGIFNYLILLLSFVLWIVLMVTAYQGKKYKLPLAGKLAEKWVG